MTEDLQQAIAGAERVFEVLDTDPDIVDAKDAVDLAEVKGKISFDQVSFHYIQGNDVLKNISFEVNPGEMVALVGPTGVGKTTLISLLARFYDPVEGRILIDGQDLKKCDNGILT